ncbi:DUF1592 domain-containing protein [Stieleria sp. ICT_E10.1]|uniref:DUF1592 domain-containing protein n=1 Tax=Stieleria sedimenti TaxID=2976331 RepID=UPI00217F50DE|nr:DUF1592 domain-containing protein [Stieleria sedimenti]MCS7469723.1 DUF1592 domain-containing protein [Stieleria sedimenti]
MPNHAFQKLSALAILVPLLLLQCFSCAAVASEADSSAEIIAPALKQHCVKCHGANDEIAGDVNLLAVRAEGLSQNTELVRGLIDVLDLEEMPPEDEPPLDPKLRRKLVAELKAILQAAVAEKKVFAHTPIRRMNRFQYNNAVIDLFDLKCTVFTLPERMVREHKGYFQPETGRMAEVVSVGSRPLGKSQLIEPRLAGVAAFPQDLRAEHGFDNRGDHLSLSPLLMEAFLTLGQSITQSPDFVPHNVGIWQTFFAAPADDADLDAELRQRLKPFLSRAFRRPVGDDVLGRYVRFTLRQLTTGVEWTDAMKSIAAATISSPTFLYLYDRSGDSTTAQVVDDLELASRLSFFLWGSIPDTELLELAAAGKLKQSGTLDAQVTRMLKDRKLKRFCDSFPAQWLQLERIISSVPNPQKYPEFYFAKYRDSMHMMIEPLLLFETVLIENHPITQLIDSDFTYRSVLLEDAYGELRSESSDINKRGGGVTVLEFRRVPVSDRRSGGVITNAAVMTMTSGPDRTQPITRGAWIATAIFNNPPDPPPADVPPLGEKPAAGEEHLTLRERLSLHRERSDCKGCHEQIDPLGFALENYDPVGRWRSRYENGRAVDVAGTLFRKHAFKDVVEFKDAVLAEKDRFTRALAGHLLSFGLARELSAPDQIALDQIAAATADDGYKLQTLIKEVIRSEPFQSKTNPKAE